MSFQAVGSSSTAPPLSLIESTRNEILSLKGTRERAESHTGVKNVTFDAFSLVHFAAIGVTQELALLDIYGYKASVYIPGKVVNGNFVIKKLFGKELEEKLYTHKCPVKPILE